MSVQTTAKWLLRFYQGTDAPDGATQQGNLAADVERSLPQSGTLAARAAITGTALRTGLIYYATDTSQIFMYDANITSWWEISRNIPLAWQTATMIGNFTAPPTPQLRFAKDADGWVQFDGNLLQNTGGTIAPNSVLTSFSIPAAWRPPADEFFPIGSGQAAPAMVKIDTGGLVTNYGGSWLTSYFTFGAVRYHV